MKGLDHNRECKIVLCGQDQIHRNTVLCFLKKMNWLLNYKKQTNKKTLHTSVIEKYLYNTWIKNELLDKGKIVQTNRLNKQTEKVFFLHPGHPAQYFSKNFFQA